MTRTQIQLPDGLYGRTRRYADWREISLAEVFRNAVEMYLNVHASAEDSASPAVGWRVPTCRSTGMKADPFVDENWREHLYSD